MAKKRKSSGTFWFNLVLEPEFWFLLLFNGFIYYEYKMNPEKEMTFIILFYLQSIVIGAFHVFRLAYFGEYTGAKNTGALLKASFTNKAKWGTAGFFALHFGIFHFVYLIFLVVIAVTRRQIPDFGLLGLAIASFIFNCLLSVFTDMRNEKRGIPVKVHFFTPYARVIPMHLTIILAFIVGIENNEKPWWTLGLEVFEVFLLLKVVADLLTFVATSGIGKEPRPNAWTWWRKN